MKYPLSVVGEKIAAQLPADAGLIVFDSFCVLCSSVVQLLIRIDTEKNLYFTSFDTTLGKEISMMVPPGPESLIFLKNGELYLQSDAVIKILQTLKYPWKSLSIIKYVPFKIREALYRFIARTRYNIFGRKNNCKLPEEQVRKRFL